MTGAEPTNKPPLQETDMPREKPVWDKPRPKDLGKSKPLTPKQKAMAKREAKAKGQVYPSLVANMNAAKKARVQ